MNINITRTHFNWMYLQNIHYQHISFVFPTISAPGNYSMINIFMVKGKSKHFVQIC